MTPTAIRLQKTCIACLTFISNKYLISNVIDRMKLLHDRSACAEYISNKYHVSVVGRQKYHLQFTYCTRIQRSFRNVILHSLVISAAHF